MYRCGSMHACIRPSNNNNFRLARDLHAIFTIGYFVVAACTALHHNFTIVCGIALEFSPIHAVTFAHPLFVFFCFCGCFGNSVYIVVGTFWTKSNKVYDQIRFFAQSARPQSFFRLFKFSIFRFSFHLLHFVGVSGLVSLFAVGNMLLVVVVY